jgi:hypothetical protein
MTGPVRYVAQYAPDIYEVIHPTRERIGSVNRLGRNRWDAYAADGRCLGRELPTRRDAGALVVAESERPS